MDEHVAPLDTDDRPDLVVIQVYITNAQPRLSRSPTRYRARGVFVALGGLHVTSLPDEAARARRRDLSRTRRADVSAVPRRLPRRPAAAPLRLDVGPHAGPAAADPPRSDRPPRATSCRTRSSSRAAVRSTATSATRTRSSRAAARSTRSAWTTRSPRSTRLPGRHLYFLDDHLLGDRRFATALFDGMRGMGRLFQGAATVDSILRGDLDRARGRRRACAASSSGSRR